MFYERPVWTQYREDKLLVASSAACLVLGVDPRLAAALMKDGSGRFSQLKLNLSFLLGRMRSAASAGRIRRRPAYCDVGGIPKEADGWPCTWIEADGFWNWCEDEGIPTPFEQDAGERWNRRSLDAHLQTNQSKPRPRGLPGATEKDLRVALEDNGYVFGSEAKFRRVLRTAGLTKPGDNPDRKPRTFPMPQALDRMRNFLDARPFERASNRKLQGM